jgi:hypothetical protein
LIILEKIGYDHLDMGINRQDVAFAAGGIKFVLDGCGSGKHSEVGAQLFQQMIQASPSAISGNRVTIPVFDRLIPDTMFYLAKKIVDTDTFRFSNLCFTMLACLETDDEFIVRYSGDGYIIGVTHTGSIETVELTNEIHADAPAYLVYNYMEDRSLVFERDLAGVPILTRTLSKETYANVGVATDGWRFVKNLEPLEKVRWEEYILADKAKMLSRIVNRNQQKFRDDIAICL